MSMNKNKVITLLSVPVCLIAAAAHGQSEPQLNGSLKAIYDIVDSDGDDFGGSLSLEGTLRLELSPKFELEAGLTGINDADSDEAEDNTGSYKLTLNSTELLLGGSVNLLQKNQLEVYGRGGLILYKIDVELEEEFFGLKPGGSASTDDSGTGFYIGLGGEMKYSPELSIIGEIQYRSLLDVLGDSSKPFDVDAISFGVGAKYYFQ